jgi:hypothetical protein
MFFVVAICHLIRAPDALCMTKIPEFTIWLQSFSDLQKADDSEVATFCRRSLAQRLKKKSDRALFIGADQAQFSVRSKAKIVCRFFRQGRVVAHVVMLPPADYSRLSL